MSSKFIKGKRHAQKARAKASVASPRHGARTLQGAAGKTAGGRTQQLHLVKHPISGVCQFCGCTEEKACLVQTNDGEQPCSWWDAKHTVCSYVDCITKFMNKLRGQSANAARGGR